MYVLPLFNIFEYKFWILIAFRPSLLHYVGSVCCQEVWQACYDWIVLDRRIALDRAIWKLISPCTLEVAPFFVSPEPCVCCVHTQCLRNVEKGVLAGT